MDARMSLRNLTIAMCGLVTASTWAQGDGIPAGTDASSADSLTQLPSFGAALARMVLSLTIVIGVGVLAIWFMRRRGPGGLLGRGAKGDSRLRVVESCALSPQHAVHLIKVGDQFVLVGSSPAGITPLSEVVLDTDALGSQQIMPPIATPNLPDASQAVS